VRAQRLTRRESAGDLLRGVAEVARARGFWWIFLMQLACYPAFAAILGLWSGPWLADVYGMSLQERGPILMGIVVAQIAGLFVWGATDRLFSSYKIPAVIGAALCAIALAIPAVAPLPRSALLWWGLYFGFVFGFMPLLAGHGKSLFPGRLTGRGLSLMNVATIGGVFIQQMVTGAMIALFPYTLVEGARVYPAEAYRGVFAFLAVQLVIVTLFYLRAPDHRSLDAKKNQ
jgi:hypothetical protein